MIKLCLDASEVTHANEHTKHANCGLHINFPNCFMMKKDHVKQNLLLWPQVPFKELISIPRPSSKQQAILIKQNL